MFVVLALLAAMPLAAQVAEGDLQWAARAEGAQSGHAKATRVDAAIAAYQRAIAANANDLDAHWKLLRAIRFKGAYVAVTNDEKKAIYAQAKKAGEAAMAHLRTKGTEKEVAAANRAIPGAGEIFFWDSVNWGEWALAYGKLAAVKEGAADRIKRDATIALLRSLPRPLQGGRGCERAVVRWLGRWVLRACGNDRANTTSLRESTQERHASSSFMRARRLLTVWKLVSRPPSQRWLT